MKPKLYLISETHFEYNDETYTPTEGGIPTILYSSRARADEECAKKNVKALKNNSGLVAQLGYTPDEIFKNTTRAAELLDMEEMDTHQLYDYNFSALSKEKSIELIGLLHSPFFEVYEVELAD